MSVTWTDIPNVAVKVTRMTLLHVLIISFMLFPPLLLIKIVTFHVTLYFVKIGSIKHELVRSYNRQALSPVIKFVSDIGIFEANSYHILAHQFIVPTLRFFPVGVNKFRYISGIWLLKIN